MIVRASLLSRCPRAILSAMGLATALAIAGCGGSAGAPIPTFKGDTVPVSGVVTLDGEPVSGATVSFAFQGTAPEGFAASGAVTDSTGKYVLRAAGKLGTPPGRYKITISRFANRDGSPFVETPGQLDFEQARMSGAVRESIPAKYSDSEKSSLIIEVTADQKDPVNFDLKTK